VTCVRGGACGGRRAWICRCAGGARASCSWPAAAVTLAVTGGGDRRRGESRRGRARGQPPALSPRPALPRHARGRRSCPRAARRAAFSRRGRAASGPPLPHPLCSRRALARTPAHAPAPMAPAARAARHARGGAVGARARVQGAGGARTSGNGRTWRDAAAAAQGTHAAGPARDPGGKGAALGAHRRGARGQGDRARDLATKRRNAR
jgi:hypothetical protein